MDENTPTVEATEVECQIAYLSFELDRLNNLFFAVTYSEDWKTWTVQEQIAFRNTVQELHGVAALHKEKLDATIWKGHSDGTVNIEVKSIRTRNDDKVPGKKAEPVTAASLLAKRLKK